MNIPPILPAVCGLAGAFSGRLIFGRWFNHLSLYSLIWGTGLALFELRWINYTPLTGEVWLMMAYAWIAFAAGSVTVILARIAVGLSPQLQRATAPLAPSARERKLLAWVVVALSAVALLGVLQHWSVLIAKFGSIAGVLVSGNVIYSMRTSGELSGMIPYLDSFGLAAAYFAGMYSARTGRISLLMLLPLLLIIVEDIAQAGRAKILNAVLLFFSAYYLTRLASTTEPRARASGKARRLLMLALVFALVLAAAEFIRGYRATFERLYGASRALNKLQGAVLITPSVYLYMSSHPGVFSAYWKAGGEHPFPGANTFAPIYRLLARAGIGEQVPDYPKFYRVPIPTNSGTYLRELHADFGIAGILVAPYVLGLGCTLLWYRIKRSGGPQSIAWLAHLYVVVIFAFFYQATRGGYWFMSLLISLLVSSVIQSRRGPAGRWLHADGR